MLYLTVFQSYDDEGGFRVYVMNLIVAGRISTNLCHWRDIPAATKPIHPNNYTGVGQPIVALPLNADHQARQFKLPLF